MNDPLDTKDEGDNSEDVEELDEFPSTPPPGFADPSSFSTAQMDRLLVLMKGGMMRKSKVVPLGVSPMPSRPDTQGKGENAGLRS